MIVAQQYGKWKIKGNLAEGAQGWAYLVYDMEDEKQESFVLKRLKNLDRIGRFEREIKAVSELSHPNIVKLIDYDLMMSDN